MVEFLRQNPLSAIMNDLLQVKYLNNIIKKITKPMMGFKAFHSAQATIDGIETAHMIRKGQLSDKQFYGFSRIVMPEDQELCAFDNYCNRTLKGEVMARKTELTQEPGNAVQSFEGLLRNQRRVYDGVAKWHVQRTSVAPQAIAVALSFCCLLGLGFPKQAFAKIAPPPHNLNSYIITFKTPDDGSAPLITPPPSKEDYYGNLSGFGEYIGQITKQELKNELNIKGEVVSIFGSINAVHVKVDENEASRLSRDKRVLLVEKDRLLTTSTTQTNPGWGLDRIDDATPTVDNEYTYSMTGLGRTIYVLDSGLNLGTKDVDDEFEGRATFLWDVNGKGGNDCQSHGSKVSSAAAGRRYGVAKGANLIIVKITNGCSKNSNVSTSVLAFNWLATNAPAGSIINWSHGFSYGNGACSPGMFSKALENQL
ncbi:hypothetical protein BMR09_14115 [Methylococcaceae bacterium CS3]|nr:hypothetical protein BMR09_14115 [Methylococcaceae bacterium CS3]